MQQWFFALPAWQQALLASLFMYAATALGAALVFVAKRFRKAPFVALTGGSAGVMIAASFFSLLLPALECPAVLPPWLTVTLGFFLGGAFLIAGDLVLSRTKLAPPALGRRNGLLFFAVTLHNIPEGMAVGVAFAGATQSAGGALAALLLAVGIAVQNFPEGACVAFPLRADGMSRAKSFLFSQGSGAVEIPACVLGAVAATALGGLMPWALSFSAGAMIAVVCSELVPECFSENKSVASAGVLLGFCFMMLLDLALG